MYHQPIKLPFSKLCKSVKSCLWLIFTLLHQFEPFYCLKLYFSFYFQCFIYKIFSVYLIMSMSETNIFENWKIFFCLFWKQTWAIRYISMKHAWMNEYQCQFQYMSQAGYSPGWSVVNGKNEKQNETESEKKWKMKMKSSLSWKPERAA